ncbi:MAG: hypothetical protein Q8O05_01320 [Chloroflexota bacterium]|nr:hypothetical protein [Chloroflexota bacterium]
MIDQKNVDRVIKRHRDFWKRPPTDRPLLGFPFQWEHGLGTKLGLKKGPLTPDMLDPELFVTFYEDGIKEGGLFEGDLLRVANCQRLPWAESRPDGSIRHRSARAASIPWSPAIMGCEVEVSSDSLWTKPLPPGQAPTDLTTLGENPWLAKAIEITGVLNRKFGKTYPTCPPDVLGPADMLAAILGTEQMCLDMIDNPAKIKSLVGLCTDVWLGVHEKFKPLEIEFRGGHCESRFQLWAPGVTTVTQDDCAIFFSPKRYDEFLTPVNRRTFASSPYSIMHAHTGAAHTFEAILSIPELGAMQVHLDPNGPSVAEMIPTLVKIQRMGKPLIIFKEFKLTELETLLDGLRPEGLCIMAISASEKAALEFMQRLIEEKK